RHRGLATVTCQLRAASSTMCLCCAGSPPWLTVPLELPFLVQNGFCLVAALPAQKLPDKTTQLPRDGYHRLVALEPARQQPRIATDLPQFAHQDPRRPRLKAFERHERCHRRL